MLIGRIDRDSLYNTKLSLMEWLPHAVDLNRFAVPDETGGIQVIPWREPAALLELTQQHPT